MNRTVNTKETTSTGSQCDACGLWFTVVHPTVDGRFLCRVVRRVGGREPRQAGARGEQAVTAEEVIASQLEGQVSRLSMGSRHLLMLEQDVVRRCPLEAGAAPDRLARAAHSERATDPAAPHRSR